MAERKIKSIRLEGRLVSVNRWDILKMEHSGADTESAKKVGEMDVYVFAEGMTDGRIIRKKIYDIQGECKRTYFSDSEELTDGTESLELMPLVGVLRGHNIFIDKKRKVY